MVTVNINVLESQPAISVNISETVTIGEFTPPPVTTLVVVGASQSITLGQPISEITAQTDARCVFSLDGNSEGLTLEQIDDFNCTVNGTPTENTDCVIVATGNNGGVKAQAIRVTFAGTLIPLTASIISGNNQTIWEGKELDPITIQTNAPNDMMSADTSDFPAGLSWDENTRTISVSDLSAFYAALSLGANSIDLVLTGSDDYTGSVTVTVTVTKANYGLGTITIAECLVLSQADYDTIVAEELDDPNIYYLIDDEL